MKQYSRTKVYVSLDAVAENLEAMHRKLKPKTQMVAVVKANGYGHGAVPIARMAERYEYIWGFATATVEEAQKLRQAGIRKPILVLGYTFQEDDERLVREEIRPTVFEYETARRLSQEARRQKKVIHIHLAVDTGMRRIGFEVQKESVREILRIRDLECLEIEGMFTHFARADETDREPALTQLEKYETFRRWLREAGIEIPICHCSNSAAIMRVPEAYLDMVRAGITMYGIYPSDQVEREKLPLRPAMEWKAQIAYIKEIPEGTAVGYGGTYVTRRKTR
ncbi:MAG: alanine racemase, partial [Blautia sp.]